MKTAVVQLIATLALSAGVVAYRADELADTRAEKRRAPKIAKTPRPPPPVAVELEEPAPPAPAVDDEAAKARAELEESPPVPLELDSDPGDPVVDVEEEDEEAKLPWWQRLWALAVSAVFAAQWVVLALARDYQDRTSRDLSLVAGIFPEEADQTPRVRVDWKWLRRKVRRRIRGLQVLIPGFLIASPLFLLARASDLPLITTVLTGGWAFYWWTVFTASRTARAWVWEDTAAPNAPLRGWIWLTQQVPGFRWWGPRFVTWVWVRTTHAMFSPAMAVELDPAAFAGLGAARLLSTIPLVRIFVRPVMSVVAAEIVIRRAFRSPALLQSRGAILEPSQHARDQAGV